MRNYVIKLSYLNISFSLSKLSLFWRIIGYRHVVSVSDFIKQTETIIITCTKKPILQYGTVALYKSPCSLRVTGWIQLLLFPLTPALPLSSCVSEVFYSSSPLSLFQRPSLWTWCCGCPVHNRIALSPRPAVCPAWFSPLVASVLSPFSAFSSLRSSWAFWPCL